MKKKFIFIIGIAASILAGCASNTEEFSKEELNKAYQGIFEKMNADQYDAAFADIEKYYGEYDYTSGEGPNKVNLYEVYYERQGMYDEEMTVVLEYLKANDLKKNINDNYYQGGTLAMEIYKASEILDKVSPKKKEEAIALIGDDLLKKYGK